MLPVCCGPTSTPDGMNGPINTPFLIFIGMAWLTWTVFRLWVWWMLFWVLRLAYLDKKQARAAARSNQLRLDWAMVRQERDPAMWADVLGRRRKMVPAPAPREPYDY